jgi:putative nucleotidyltransferase with HDIG domain
VTLPIEADMVALHRKYAPSDKAFELVYTHCLIVADIAAQIMAARHLDLDAELVRAGSLLHDIGVYEVLDADGRDRPDRPYITHGIRGEAILRQEGSQRRSAAYRRTTPASGSPATRSRRVTCRSRRPITWPKPTPKRS